MDRLSREFFFSFVFYSIAFKMAYMSCRGVPDSLTVARIVVSAKTRTGATPHGCSLDQPGLETSPGQPALERSDDGLLTLLRVLKIGVEKKKEACQ